MYSFRFYYSELHNGRTIGTTYVWCHNCHKYVHFIGQPKSLEYVFNDPLEKFDKTSFGYTELDSYWEEGLLPQKFKKKV